MIWDFGLIEDIAQDLFERGLTVDERGKLAASGRPMKDEMDNACVGMPLEESIKWYMVRRVYEQLRYKEERRKMQP